MSDFELPWCYRSQTARHKNKGFDPTQTSNHCSKILAIIKNTKTCLKINSSDVWLLVRPPKFHNRAFKSNQKGWLTCWNECGSRVSFCGSLAQKASRLQDGCEEARGVWIHDESERIFKNHGNMNQNYWMTIIKLQASNGIFFVLHATSEKGC